jgi:MYXO-CTERM domain-containing protein
MFPGGTDGPGGLDALIHEARLYDTALTQAEIQGLVMVPEPSASVFGVLTAGLLLARRRRCRR